MLRREKAPLQEELPVFTEFAALRACVSKTGPWHDGLRAPALGRPEAAQPPVGPPKWLSQSGYARAQDELLWNTCLGSADARLWVTFAKDTSQEEAAAAEAASADAHQKQEEATAAAGGAKDHLDLKRRLTAGQSFSEVANVKAFLCHKSLLSSSSPLLKSKLQEAEVRNHELRTEHARAMAAKKKDQARTTFKKAPTFRGEMKKLDPLVEIEITVHECGEAFSEVMDWLYGKPLQLTSRALSDAADNGWWPLLSLAQELQLLELEDMLRTPLMELTGAGANYMWSLLHLCVAHRLEAEMARCCDFLARLGGRGAMTPENKFPELPLVGLTALMTSQAWVVSEELEIYFILMHWMQGQPWYKRCAKRRDEDNEEEPEKVPREVAEAAGSWGIRWAFLPRDNVEKLAEIGLVPIQLVGDCDRWRFTARVRAPETPKGEEWGHLDKSPTASSLRTADSSNSQQHQQRSRPPPNASQSLSLAELDAESDAGRRGSEGKGGGAGSEDITEGGAAGVEDSDGRKAKFDLWSSKGVVVYNDEQARAMYGIPDSLCAKEAESLKLVLETQMPPGYPIPIFPGTTTWRNGAVLSQQNKAQAVASEFLSGTRKLCDRADGRFLPERRKSQNEAELNRVWNVRGDPNEEALTKARKVAMQHLEFANAYCPWMNRRRCLVRNFKLPDDYQEFFPIVYEDQDVLVLICRKHDPTGGGQHLHLAQQKDADIQARASLALLRRPDPREGENDQEAALLSAIMQRSDEKEAAGRRGSMPASPKHPVQAPKQQQPATRSPRVAHAGTGAVERLPAKAVAQPDAKARGNLSRGGTFDALDSPARRRALKAASTESETTRLVGTPPLKGGRHEVLFRILIKRSRSGPAAQRLLAANSVATALSKAVRLGMAVYSGGTHASMQPRDDAGASTPRRPSLPSREMGTSVKGPSSSLTKNDSEVATERCEQAQLCKALAKSFGRLSALGEDGLIDVTILMVLDLVKPPKLSYAVEAVISHPYSTDAPEDESEEDKLPPAAPTDKQEPSKDGPSEEGTAAVGPSTASASLAGPITSELDVKQEGAGGKKAFRLTKKDKRASTKPMDENTTLSEPTNFLQDRRFLKVWHSEEMLAKELQIGFNVSKAALSAGGPRARFAPVIEVAPHQLSSIGGAGGQARLEILPHGALRPDWWVRRMGGTADMPRSAAGAEVVKGWQM